MILVTGATGTVGSALVAALLAQDAKLRVLVRDPARLPPAVAGRVEVARGDLGDRAALEAAFAGVGAAFLLTKPRADQAELERAFLTAAGTAPRAHVVRLSVLGANPLCQSPVRRWHGEADAALRTSGLAATILRANFFMQNLLMFARAIATRGSFALPAADARVSMVDVRDIADVAAALLLGRHAPGGTLALTGPEALGFADVASAIGAVLGKPVAYHASDSAAFRDRLVAVGQPDWYADAMAGLYDDFRAGLNTAVSPDVASVLRRPARGFAAFARDMAERWAAAS